MRMDGEAAAFNAAQRADALLEKGDVKGGAVWVAIQEPQSGIREGCPLRGPLPSIKTAVRALLRALLRQTDLSELLGPRPNSLDALQVT
jgi:hypothetical protein